MTTIAILACFSVLALISLFTGAKLVLVAVLVLVSVYLTFEPRRWPYITFFLFTVAVTLLPVRYGESDFGGPSPMQFWYWALSIVVPLLFASLGVCLGPRRKSFWKGVPHEMYWPTAGFLLVTLTSITYGVVRSGAQASESLREASGVALLLVCLILCVTLNYSRSQVWDIFSRVERIVLAYSLFYIARYLPKIVENGTFIRERSPLLYFSGLFAVGTAARILLLGRRKFDVSVFFVFLVSAILSGSRSVILSMLFTMLVLVYLRYRPRARKLIAFGVLVGAVLYVAPVGLTTSTAEADTAIGQITSRFVASPTSDSSSLARVAEMIGVVQVIRRRPLLGLGMGASFTWTAPFEGEVQSAFVDNGIGFLLLKMGVLGLAIFAWWAFTLTRRVLEFWLVEARRESLLILVTLVYYLCFLPFGPSFFQFSYSFWIGTVAGFLCLARLDLPPGLEKPRSC